jgi:uncharacterized protein YndB with AHSA1/START domain
MNFDKATRREFSVRLGWLWPSLGLVGAAARLMGQMDPVRAAGSEEITRTNEAIHQEVVFKASRTRVYGALTDSKQFDALTRLSAAMTSGMIPAGGAVASVSHEAGGTFSAFGGYVTGRQIELVPGQRIVQAWRAGSWDAGVYSIARFELLEQGTGTKLVFDHTGFPTGEGPHLADGWRGNYWEPLTRFLG